MSMTVAWSTSGTNRPEGLRQSIVVPQALQATRQDSPKQAQNETKQTVLEGATAQQPTEQVAECQDELKQKQLRQIRTLAKKIGKVPRMAFMKLYRHPGISVIHLTHNHDVAIQDPYGFRQLRPTDLHGSDAGDILFALQQLRG